MYNMYKCVFDRPKNKLVAFVTMTACCTQVPRGKTKKKKKNSHKHYNSTSPLPPPLRTARRYAKEEKNGTYPTLRSTTDLKTKSQSGGTLSITTKVVVVQQ